MVLPQAFDEIVDFIAAGSSAGDVVAFRPSEAAKARIADLIGREKQTGLSPEERSELDHFERLEHVMRLAKARARRHLLDD